MPELAILGGDPIRPEGPPPWPLYDDEIETAVHRAIQLGHWGKYSGPNLERLESELAAAFNVTYAIGCSSGTVAMELALRACQIRRGDEVLMAAYDFSGNFLNVHALDAMPVLADLAPENWNLGSGQLEKPAGEKIRAIIMSHLHGGVVPASALREFADKNGIYLIEDAAQMPGAEVEGRTAGSWGDLAILSFGGSKLLSAGRGGAVLTSDRKLFQRLRLLCQRGNHPYPLSELQATVLLPQLEKLATRNRQRTESVEWLRSTLKLPGLRLLTNTVRATPGFYKVGIQFDASQFGTINRDQVANAVRAEGIAVSPGFRSLHAARSTSRFRAWGELTEAEKAHHNMLILHHPVLLRPRAELEQVVAAFEKVHQHQNEFQPEV